MRMIDHLKLKRTSKSLAFVDKNYRENDELNSLSMHSNNDAETIYQLEFCLGSITAKNEML